MWHLTTCVTAQKHEHNGIWGKSQERLYTNALAAVYQNKIKKLDKNKCFEMERLQR